MEILDTHHHTWRRADLPWLAGPVRDAAGRPNVAASPSRLGTFLHRNDAGHTVAAVTGTVEVLGAGRGLLGSKVPAGKLWTGYGGRAGVYCVATAALGGVAPEAAFRDTAARVHRPQTQIGNEGKTRWH